MASRRTRKRQRRAQEAAGGDRNPADARGQGGGVSWAGASRSDLALLRHAINADWPVPPHRRRPILADVLSLLAGTSDVRLTLGVARVVIAADQSNRRALEEAGRASEDGLDVNVSGGETLPGPALG
jgi:hypothetical protein